MTYPLQSSTVHVETLNDEVCLYDWERKQVHALNPTARLVWQMCDGKTGPAQMATQLRTQLGTELDAPQAEALVSSGLAQLNEAHLLQGELTPPVRRSLLTRRQMLKMGLAVALLPVISSILAPTPVEAQSGLTRLVLYAANNGATYDGNLGGRAGADLLCLNSANKPAGYTRFRAFISVDANDEIRDMPTNYGVPTNLPIVGPNGTQLASNWADLLDGTIGASLGTAGVVNQVWWSGSETDGSAKPAGWCCNGWTSNAQQFLGGIGLYSNTDPLWINWGVDNCFMFQRSVVCIAF